MTFLRPTHESSTSMYPPKWSHFHWRLFAMSEILMLDAFNESNHTKNILIFSQQNLYDQPREVFRSWPWSVLFLRSRIFWRKHCKTILPTPPSSIPAHSHKHTHIHTHSCLPFIDQVSLNHSRTQQLWVCKPFWEKLTSPTTPLFSVYITRNSSKRFNAYNVPYEYINWPGGWGGGVWGSLLFFHQYIWHHLWRVNKRHTVKRTDLDKMLLFVLHKHRGIFKQRKTFHRSLGTSFLWLNYTSMFTPLCSDRAGI